MTSGRIGHGLLEPADRRDYMIKEKIHSTISDWVEFVEQGDSVQTEHDYINWCSLSLKKLLPFDAMVTAIGRRYGDVVAVDEIDLIGHPETYKDALMSGLRISERKALGIWLKSRSPLIIDSQNASQLLSSAELDEFNKYNFKNIWAHGVIEPNGLSASYFSFSGSETIDVEHIEKILKMIVPFLHQVRNALLWRRLIENDSKHVPTQLTNREMEVLQYLISGKTNLEIASIFQRSTLTVKNQVQSILTKLNAKSRADAVRVALQRGLISLR